MPQAQNADASLGFRSIMVQMSAAAPANIFILSSHSMEAHRRKKTREEKFQWTPFKMLLRLLLFLYLHYIFLTDRTQIIRVNGCLSG